VSAFQIVRVQAEQDPSEAPSAKPAQTQGNEHAVEGNVVSMTGHTLVVRSDDNQYHLFTYDAQTVHADTVKTGDRISVTGGAPDENGVRVAQSVTVIHPGGEAAGSGPGPQAAPPPAQVSKTSKQIEYEARRFHVGGRVGSGFSPELFMFGPQAHFGPFFSQRLLFQPNVEFGFGEITDMYAINGEMAYRMAGAFHGEWVPYFGMGPSFNFIHRSATNGTTSFGNFTYKTGFNVFVGLQKHHTFLEMKTALWSNNAPVLRLFAGYNF
jgi:hypothetical protein